jgi:ferredoxin-NADP reductase
MQIIPLQAALGVTSGVGMAVGIVVIAALAGQTVLLFISAIHRRSHQNTQMALERQRLELQVKAAEAQLKQVEETKLPWNGLRKFKVTLKVCECEDVYSFYLQPHDRKPLPIFKPGQYLTFQLDLPGQSKPVVRCYSISDSPTRTDYYRVTIKREKPPADRPELPPGLVSSYFCDMVKEGDLLNVKAPAGHFWLNATRQTPVVLISGGVGITPMLSMASAILESGSTREIWFFHGCRNHEEHICKAHVEQLAAKYDNFLLHVCYSRPHKDDVLGKDYQHAGRVSPELLLELLPSNNFEFYLCGNGAFMKSITDGLEAWGVPEKDVHFEAFGPATVKKKAAPAPAAAAASTAPAIKVMFGKSNKEFQWNPTQANLLDFARDQGIRIDSGCCAGSCGSCVVAIKSGAVEYLKDPDAPPEDGCCLTCICKPKTDLVLDA